MRTMLIAGFLAAASLPAAAMELSGPATVIDGDTVIVAGRHVRLWGIDAPELHQTCGRLDGVRWPCGEFARDALVRAVTGARTVCETVGKPDRYGRDVARCAVGTVDLGGMQVRDGWALDYRAYSRGTYAGQQEEARAGLNGIWSGSFEQPSAWRRGVR